MSTPTTAPARAAVTAGAGFLTGSPDDVAHLQGDSRFRLVRRGATDRVHVLGDVDLVLRLGSPASPVDHLHLPLETLEVGAVGTVHALDSAEDEGVRSLLAPTSEVHSDPQAHPRSEDCGGHVDPAGPRGVWDAAERCAEALTTAHRTAHGVDAAIVRTVDTHCPRTRPADGRAVPAFVRQALAGEPVTVAGDGQQTRSICCVDDLVAGVLALAASGQPGPVDIGDPTEPTVEAIARDVLAARGSASPVVSTERPVDDPPVHRPDTALARRLLGGDPRAPWAQGSARAVARFRGALDGGGRS